MKVPHECEAVFLKPISGAVYVVYFEIQEYKHNYNKNKNNDRNSFLGAEDEGNIYKRNS